MKSWYELMLLIKLRYQINFGHTKVSKCNVFLCSETGIQEHKKSRMPK